MVILVAFDPDPFDCDRKSEEFRSDVTKKIKVRLLGLKGLCAGYCFECGFAVESDCDGSGAEFVFVAKCLKDEESTGDAGKFAAVGTLRVDPTGYNVDRDDTLGGIITT